MPTNVLTGPNRARLLELILSLLPETRPLAVLEEVVSLSAIPDKSRIRWPDSARDFVLGLITHCERYGADGDGVLGLQRLAEGVIGLGNASPEDRLALYEIVGGPPVQLHETPFLEPSPRVEELFRSAVTGDRRALVVGIDKYIHLRSLRYAARDAEAIYERLSRFGRYEEASIRLVRGTTAAGLGEREIEQEIDWLVSGLGQDDSALLYFAGHGTPSDSDAVMATSEARVNRPAGIAISELRTRMGAVGSVVMMLDACHSGVSDLGRGAMEDVDPDSDWVARVVRPQRGWLTMAAALHGQVAFESTEKEHGRFTDALLRGLSGGAGQRVENHVLVDAASLAAFVAWTLEREYPQQVPRFTADLPGLHVLALAPAPIAPR